MPDDDDRGRGFVHDLWCHPWGRILVIAVTVAVVSWAIRETAVITYPVVAAIGDVIVPLAIGFTIAYVLTPVVDALTRRGFPRLLSTSILFLFFVLLSLIGASVVVPAVVKQSTDLAGRMVEEFYYEDVNANARYDRGEPILYPAADRPGYLFKDVDRDRVQDPEEPLLVKRDHLVRLEPSLFSRLADWYDQRTEGLRLMMGAKLTENSTATLDFYGKELGPLLEVLDAGLAAARKGAPADTWPPELQAPAPEDPPEVELAWLGVVPEEVAAAAENLPEEDRSAWRAGMAALVERYRERHREFVEALDHLGEGGGRESELVQRMRLAMRKPLDEERTESAMQLWERIKESEAEGQEAGRELVGRLLRDGRGDSGLVRRIADSVGEGIDHQVAELPTVFGKWVSGFLTNINGILAFLLDLVLIPIYAFFLTLGMPKLRRSARAMVPRHGRERTMRILHAIERVVAAFFRGRLIVCAICSILVYAGFAPIGVPYAVLFALLIGLATTVPLLGLIFLVPALMLTAVEGGEHLTLRISLIVAVYTVVQTLEATVFTPTIMGREVELHPVLLILALLVFGNLLGILGLILAVPIAATLRILAREFLFPRLGIGEPVTSSISRRVAPP